MEDSTSTAIKDHISEYTPDNLVTGLGGRGIAAEFAGTKSGPRVLLRCEMDALPINEDMDIPYRSVIDGVSHKCGHDGHMAILIGVAARLHKHPPARGSVVLLFQPAEETGEGARKVIIDRKFRGIEPDFVFALHNLPGFPTGCVIMKNGAFASASRGIAVELTGASSHASEPHLGINPALAVAEIIEAFSSLHQPPAAMDDKTMVTVIHARVGERAFGISPGDGCILATLRTHNTGVMHTISRGIEQIVEAIAETHKLEYQISWMDEFPITENSEQAVKVIAAAAENLGIRIIQPDVPFPWSEDFGHFTTKYPGALFGIGAGIGTQVLHSPEYDFPDELIAPGVEIFIEIVNELLN